jgi:hypothetical protein
VVRAVKDEGRELAKEGPVPGRAAEVALGYPEDGVAGSVRLSSVGLEHHHHLPLFIERRPPTCSRSPAHRYAHSAPQAPVCTDRAAHCSPARYGSFAGRVMMLSGPI